MNVTARPANINQTLVKVNKTFSCRAENQALQFEDFWLDHVWPCAQMEKFYQSLRLNIYQMIKFSTDKHHSSISYQDFVCQAWLFPLHVTGSQIKLDDKTRLDFLQAILNADLQLKQLLNQQIKILGESVDINSKNYAEDFSEKLDLIENEINEILGPTKDFNIAATEEMSKAAAAVIHLGQNTGPFFSNDSKEHLIIVQKIHENNQFIKRIEIATLAQRAITKYSLTTKAKDPIGYDFYRRASIRDGLLVAANKYSYLTYFFNAAYLRELRKQFQ